MSGIQGVSSSEWLPRSQSKPGKRVEFEGVKVHTCNSRALLKIRNKVERFNRGQLERWLPSRGQMNMPAL